MLFLSYSLIAVAIRYSIITFGMSFFVITADSASAMIRYDKFRFYFIIICLPWSWITFLDAAQKWNFTRSERKKSWNFVRLFQGKQIWKFWLNNNKGYPNLSFRRALCTLSPGIRCPRGAAGADKSCCFDEFLPRCHPFLLLSLHVFTFYYKSNQL